MDKNARANDYLLMFVSQLLAAIRGSKLFSRFCNFMVCSDYFKKWREVAQCRNGFCEKMLLSKPTEEGVVTTCKAMADLITSCLEHGASYVITRRCNQGEILFIDNRCVPADTSFWH